MNHVTKFAYSAHKMWLSNLGMSHLTTNTRKHNFAAKLFEIIVVNSIEMFVDNRTDCGHCVHSKFAT